MKRVLLVLFAAIFSLSTFAQGKQNGNGKDKHEKDHKVERKYKNGDARYSKNVPAQVSRSFKTDFPGASNVSWTKSKGNWTANFRNGLARKSVSYHANGRRTNINYENAQKQTSPSRFPW